MLLDLRSAAREKRQAATRRALLPLLLLSRLPNAESRISPVRVYNAAEGQSAASLLLTFLIAHPAVWWAGKK